MFLEQMISQCLWRASSWKNLAADRSYREQYSHTEWSTGLGIRNVNTHAVTPQALVKSFLPPLLQCCVCAGTRCLHSTNTASPTVTENSTGFRLWSWWRVQEGPFFSVAFFVPLFWLHSVTWKIIQIWITYVNLSIYIFSLLSNTFPASSDIYSHVFFLSSFKQEQAFNQ